MKRYFLTLIFLLLCGIAFADDGYVRLAIKGTNVNVRPQPQAKGPVVSKANTGDVFIAERWPVTDVNDGSKWYKIVSRLDNKTGAVDLLKYSFAISFDDEEGYDCTSAYAFVNANFAEEAPLAPGDMERIMETPDGEGFSALDMSPENQRRMAVDNGGIYGANLFPDGSELKEYVVYREPSKESDRKKYPLNNSSIGAFEITDKSKSGWLQIISGSSTLSSGWIESDAETWQAGDFSLGIFMTYCLGANVPDIVRRWGQVKSVERDNNVIGESWWHFVTDTTTMSFDGLKVSFTDSRNFQFTLTQRGSGMGGIFIGEKWCDKEYLKRLFASFPEEEIQTDKKDGAEVWRLNLGHDGWFYDYEIVFDGNGLVRELQFSCHDANLMN